MSIITNFLSDKLMVGHWDDNHKLLQGFNLYENG